MSLRRLPSRPKSNSAPLCKGINLTFFDIAAPMAKRGEPQIRLRPRSKIAMDSDWPSLATTDLAILEKWSAETPDANAGSVAKSEIGGFWFWEIDKPEALQRMEAETGQRLRDVFRVRSSPGRGHHHFLQSVASIAMGNIAQGFVKGEDWSARVSNQYVVSPNGVHPSGSIYQVISDHPISEAPEWLINWLVSQKVEAKKAVVLDENAPIPSGSRNASLASIAGRLRHAGLTQDLIEAHLLRVNAEQCIPPLPESEVKTIAWSIARYPAGRDDRVLVRGQSAGLPPADAEDQEAAIREEMAQSQTLSYPHFPRWVFSGCSLFEGFAKPLSEVNMRYPEFMFLPAMAMLLNYVGLRVKISGIGNTLPNIFMVLIGKRGEVIKSSCVRDAMRYLKNVGTLADANAALLSSQVEKRSLVWTVGSPEGFGLEMNRLGCTNGILFYDELKALANKVKIENSNLSAALLLLYESEKYQNTVKDRKGCFSLESESYCASLIACCTDKNFLEEWGKMQAGSTGLEDRFFFLLQPEKLKPRSIYTHADTELGAITTRSLVEKAIAQGTYKIADRTALDAKFQAGGMTNRQQLRAQKWALGFAIDLGRDEIDADCIERGIAVTAYEKQVKEYLRPFEAENRDGAIQMQIITHLQQSQNRLELRELQRRMNWLRFGSAMWLKAYHGLLSSKVVRETGSGHKGDPKMSELIQYIARSDED